ncbi:MAG: hypothetical protein HRT89_15155 [Lentisphaeria bacterium]|nr:hypothetical protein [Lentisphaeria bacterium]NQZ69394.1 hypothetical protein [Lentisphaeria bacterium]
MKSKKFLICLILLVVSSCASNDNTSSNSPKPYPLDKCVVTDNELGSMGDAVSYTHENQIMKFCCKPCIRKFKKDPAKYLKKLEK